VSGDDERLRARLFLRGVLPLVKVVLVERPAYGWLLGGAIETVQLEVAGAVGDEELGAWIDVRDGAVEVTPGHHPSPAVRVRFADVGRLNAFFAGRPVLPRIIGSSCQSAGRVARSIVGLRRAFVLARLLPLLASLRLLTPQVIPGDAAGRALKIKLMLYAATLALAQLHRGGHPQMRALVDDSPDRVYQWTVEESRIGSWLRMDRGRIRAGRGTYARRRPFVHFVFPTVDAACRVLTSTGSQMEAVTRGDVRTEGSPEYSRRISGLLQKADALLMG